MQQRQFAALVNSLCVYYERKPPNDLTMDHWFLKVQNIPSEAIGWIESSVTSRADAFPRNLPNMIYGLYHEWISSHPEKQIAKADFGCKNNRRGEPDICFDGLISVWREDKDLAYQAQYVFRCTDCRRVDQGGIPEASLVDLIGRGYRIETPRFDMALGKEFKRRIEVVSDFSTVDTLAKKVMGQVGW